MSFPKLPEDRALSFKSLMAVQSTGQDTFLSLVGSWPPKSDNGETRAFGGHVYAQAAYAACQTVAKGMTIHNVTGHFILPGRVDIPFRYHVRRIRDGSSYSLRSVDVYQTAPNESSKLQTNDASSEIAPTPCFVATIGFKRDERNFEKWISFRHQDAPVDHLRRTYGSVLANKEISSHPLTPDLDAIWWTDMDRVRWAKAEGRFPGVEIRKVDMAAYNRAALVGGEKKAGNWRQLSFYRRIIDEDEEEHAIAGTDGEESDSDQTNLDVCAHLYASDRNSLFLVQRALTLDDRRAIMGSLSHTVLFHGSPQQLRSRGPGGIRKWFVQEARTSNSGAHRGCHESRLWDWDEGRIVGTTIQDGMVRVPPVSLKL